ncbi:hypothetical protein [Kribbella sp. NPDC006257]|uniref:hypothetical protein n=1 Tax=Kribbella sp. NPDC006257 TaxID=3156738 RepID=UPI0033B0A230
MPSKQQADPLSAPTCAFGLRCTACGTTVIQSNYDDPKTAEQREVPDRRTDGLSPAQIEAVKELTQPISGGDLGHVELAEALLLDALTGRADRNGIIGPLSRDHQAVARLQYCPIMLQAWRSLLESNVLAVHASSPSAAFGWTDAGDPFPLPYDAHWYIARGRAGDEPADTAVAVRTAVLDLFQAEHWGGDWISDVYHVGIELLAAEGTEYFRHLLATRGACPMPTSQGQTLLQAAMNDAADDHSLGQIIYLAWKPVAQAVDPYRFAKQTPAPHVTDEAVAEFAKRAPRYRANLWTVEAYDLDTNLPPAATYTALWHYLGGDPRTTSVAWLADAAGRRADHDTRQYLQHIAEEQRLQDAEPLPAGAWQAVLQALDAASRAPETAPLDEPWVGIEEMTQPARPLAAATADYLREIDKLYPDDRAQHLASCYNGAGLAAHAMLFQEVGCQSAVEHSDSDFAANTLQQWLLDAYSATLEDQPT